MKSSYKVITLILILLTVIIITRLRSSDSEKQEISIIVDDTDDMKGLGYSGQRKVVQDSKGNYFVAYRKKYQGKYEIYMAKIYFNNNKWNMGGSDKPIIQIKSGADQRVPSISIDNKDHIYVVWYGSDSGSKDQLNNRQIKFVKSMNGGESWTEAKVVSFVEGYSKNETYWQEHPYILTVNDMAYVVWEGKDGDNSKQQIKFSKSSDGGNSWTNWKNIFATADNTQSRPTLVLDGNGRLHLFMYSSASNSENNQQIKYSWSDDNGDSWSELETLSDQNFDSRHVSAAADLKGNVHIAWRQWGQNDNSKIFYRKLDGDAWARPIIVSRSDKSQFFPSLGLGEKGNVVVSWMESDDPSGLPREDPENGKIYSTFLKGKSFAKSREISSGDENLYSNISENFNSNFLMPIVFESLDSSKKRYDIIFKLIEI